MAVHVLTLVKSDGDAQSPITPAALAIDQALSTLGGTQIMRPLLGDALAFQSDQLPAGTWDVLLHQFASVETYQSATKQESYIAAVGASKVLAFGFARTAFLTDLLVPLVFPVKRLLAMLVGGTPDLETQAERTSHISSVVLRGSTAPVSLAELDAHIKADPEPARPCVMVNLMRKKTDEEAKAADARYGKGVMAVFAAYGCRPIHVGPVVPLGGNTSEDAIQFDTVALVHYPSREFALKLTRSAHFQGLLGDKDKSLADTLVQCSLPARL
jgi:hypothetical protein